MKSDSLQSTPEIKNENLDYWLAKIPRNLHPINLRLDFQRPVNYQDKRASIEFTIEGELGQKILGLANSEPFLVYAILTAGLNICLYKYEKNPCIVVGSPMLKAREHTPDELNALPVISEIKDSCSFKELLIYIRGNLLEFYKKQEFSTEGLLKRLGMDTVVNKCPLFDISLALTNIHHPMPEVKNDIGITFQLEGNQLTGTICFNEALFHKGSLENLLLHYTRVLKVVLENPGVKISDISLISEEEKHELLVTLNDTAAEFPSDKCLHQLFEEYAEKTPGATALVQGSKRLSFRDLNEQANQLAHHLQELGVKPNSIVGLFVERSIEMIVGLLAVLKAGGTYVPLDSTYPMDRIAAMLEIGDFELILTKLAHYNNLPKNEKTRVICLDYDSEKEKIARQSKENCTSQATVEDLCYMIFTSGSTGVPKGACVYHKGWTNLLHWFTKEFDINPSDKNLIISSFSFDLTQRAIAMSLINGNELHLLDANHYDPNLILKTIDQEQITLMNCAPSTFYPLSESNKEGNWQKLRTLRVLFLGGEPISASRLKDWVESDQCKADVANVYGIAECTDVSSFHVLKDYDRYIKSSVPAGKPIFNTQVYILDEEQQLLPKGFVGEICVAGEGVGKGYINDEALTAEKFVPNPFDPEGSGKLYRTGDYGRLLADGCIEYIGRGDQQIKIRGLRIDLGDIETAIRQNPLIREAVVVDKALSEDDRRLIAYLVKEQQNDELSDDDVTFKIREFLNGKLPGYMVPNLFCVLEKLPLTPNGKVDRSVLPIPGAVTSCAATAKSTSADPEMEKTLTKVFAETLKLDNVKVDDNFFDIGGHSLLAAQVVTSVSQSFNIELAQIDLLANPTAKRFALRIQEIQSSMN